MAELADAIVQSGRETLESAMRMVEAHPSWRARVVYGDTGAAGCLGVGAGVGGRVRGQVGRMRAQHTLKCPWVLGGT